MNKIPCAGAMAEAIKNPGGWVYEIRGAYGPSDDVPASAVVGAWKVNDQGEIVGDFIPNPNFIENLKGNSPDFVCKSEKR